MQPFRFAALLRWCSLLSQHLMQVIQPLQSCQQGLNQALPAAQDISRIMSVPRASLGITCASKGAVAGWLYIRDTPASVWQDCTACGGCPNVMLQVAFLHKSEALVAQILERSPGLITWPDVTFCFPSRCGR
jgi:hypothetical protein